MHTTKILHRLRSVLAILAATAALFIGRVAAAEGPTEGKDFTPEVKLLYRIVACTGDEPLPANVDPKIVERYCKKLTAHMAAYQKQYIEGAEKFIAEFRPPSLPTTLVYPFGGGDLLSALTTYPDATEITTMSLEHAGDPRRISAGLNAVKQEASLETVRRMAGGLLLYNDSKTESLMKIQRGDIPGELSFFLIGLAVHGYEPVSLRYFRLEKDGAIHYLTEQDIADEENKNAKLLHQAWVSPDFSEAFSNSEIRFRKRGDPNAPIRIHRHIAANLADDRMTADPSVLAHLEQKGRIVAMTKAASYLLWRNDFSKIRDYLLSHMDFMISDSTGIPPKFASKAGFVQDTFGRFQSSFLGANEDYNKDFRALWKKNPKRDLPFRYGYIDASRNYHLLVTRRAPAGEGAPAPTGDAPKPAPQKG
jgi:hypothetical protein